MCHDISHRIGQSSVQLYILVAKESFHQTKVENYVRRKVANFWLHFQELLVMRSILYDYLA